jgi:hypothetical protein
MTVHAHENLLVSLDLAEVRGDLARLSVAQTETINRAKIRLAQGDASVALAVESILALTVTMPAYRFAEASKAITKLAKKAAKRGLPVPMIEEVARETRDDDESVWITARLLGATPTLNGWRCLATIVPWLDSDKVQHATVCTASGVDYLPEWSAHPERCEHCNTNRRRAMTFVLGHEDGRSIQVGRSCLNDYIGTDALAAWFVWSELREIEHEYSGLGYDYTAHAQWLANNASAATKRDTTPRKLPTLESFLESVAAEIRVNGYKPSDRFSGEEGTGRAVARAMKLAQHERPIAVDNATMKKTIAWLDELVGRDVDAVSDYENAVLDAAARSSVGGVRMLDANVLASAISAARRPVQRNECLPGVQVGDRVDLQLTVERELGWAVQCRDSEGRCVLLRGCRGYMQPDAQIHASAEVDSLGYYRGVRQTILSRAQITPAQ